MSEVSYVYKPRNPECLYGIGAKRPDPRAIAASGGVESDDGIDFWHPALPEVLVYRQEPQAGGHICAKVKESAPRFRPIYELSFALLFSLLLPAISQAQAPCKVNVNSASPAQLALLINTGPALAGKIAAARATGPLDAAKLDAVSGIGVKWLEYNEPHVAYSGETTCKDKLKKPAAPKTEAEKDGARLQEDIEAFGELSEEYWI